MLNLDLARLRPELPGFPARSGVLASPEAASAQKPFSLGLVLTSLLVHAVLGPLMGRYPVLATVHAWATLLVCLCWAGLGRRWETGLIACAYLCGSEVLWRATGAGFYWEGAKYAIGLVALITLLRRGNRSHRCEAERSTGRDRLHGLCRHAGPSACRRAERTG